MKKRTILIIILILLIIITLIITFLKINDTNLTNILKKENYTLISHHQKGEKNELYTVTNDTKTYQKEEILIIIYTYNNYQEIENTIMENYNEESKNNLPIELTNEKTYIQKKRCDDETCSYELGYKNYLITCKVNQTNTKEIESLFKKITTK